MSSEPFIVEKTDHVVKVTLNRPDRMNALDIPLLDNLYDFLVELNEGESETRALIFTGSGKSFCAGGDVKVFADYASLDQQTDFVRAFTRRINDVIVELRHASYPVIAAINGVILGAGLNLALAADMRLAAESATFITASYAALGLVPASGGSYLLPTIIGPARAWEFFTLRENITAAKALEMDLVSQVYPDSELQFQATKLAERLAKGPTRAYARTKALINNFIAGSSLDYHLNLELIYQKEMSKTHDYKEGIRAFLEKREPMFLGK